MSRTPEWIELACCGAPVPRGLFPWGAEMDATPHDPLHHAEGSPWRHTELVAAALEEEARFADLPVERQEVLRLAAWCHDIGKPATTRIEMLDGVERVRQPGHAALGATMTWQALIDSGVPARRAREVHALVAWHMRPTHMVDLDPEKAFARAVHYGTEAGGGSWNELIALSRADQRGRTCLTDRDRMVPVECLEILLEDFRTAHGVDLAGGPWPFDTEAARLAFMRKTDPGAAYATIPEPDGARVTLLSGLPGSGKSSYAAETGLPVISLDRLRAEMGVGPGDNQGRVIQAAFDALRGHLRSGMDVIWDATSLTRQQRRKISGLVLDYGGRIDAVSFDVPLDLALARNTGRSDPVPEARLRKMAAGREPVTTEEAHTLSSVDAEGGVTPIFGPAKTGSPLLYSDN